MNAPWSHLWALWRRLLDPPCRGLFVLGRRAQHKANGPPIVWRRATAADRFLSSLSLSRHTSFNVKVSLCSRGFLAEVMKLICFLKSNCRGFVSCPLCALSLCASLPRLVRVCEQVVRVCVDFSAPTYAHAHIHTRVTRRRKAEGDRREDIANESASSPALRRNHHHQLHGNLAGISVCRIDISVPQRSVLPVASFSPSPLSVPRPLHLTKKSAAGAVHTIGTRGRVKDRPFALTHLPAFRVVHARGR